MRAAYLTTLLVSLCVPLGGLAQEAPAAGATPVPERPGETQAWMGVAVSSAPAALGHQVKLARGVGLVVEFVEPKSPAERGDLKPFDLLLKLDDQWLINPEQFAVLVRMHRGGDRVKLTFLREGNEQATTLQLVDHESRPGPGWDRPAPGSGPGDGPPFGPGRQPFLSHDGPPNRAALERIISWVDGSRQVSVITHEDGNTGLQVNDGATGRMLFDGPINTPQERDQLPPDLRGVLDLMSRITAEFDGKPADHHESPTSGPMKNPTPPSTKDAG